MHNTPISLSSSPPGWLQSGQSKWPLAFKAFVKHEIGNPQLSVQMIADHFNISSRQLQRRVQEQLGCSPLQFLREARLQTARSYLLEGRFATIRRTAEAVGFQDQRYFANWWYLHSDIP